jgi:hypothetical protein
LAVILALTRDRQVAKAQAMALENDVEGLRRSTARP